MFYLYTLVLALAPGSGDFYSLAKLVALAVACFALGWGKPWARTRMDWAYFLFLGVLVLSTAVNQDWWLSLVGQYDAYFSSVLAYTLVYTLAQAAIGTDQQRLSKHVVRAVGISCLVAIVQKAGYLEFHALPQGRVIGTIGNPTFLASAIALAMPLALHHARGWVPILGVTLLLSQSRAGVLACFGGILTYLWLRHPSKRAQVALGAIFAGLMALALVVSLRSPTQAREGDLGRKWMVRAAILSFQASPYLGSGPETFMDQFNRYRTPQTDRDLKPSYSNGYAHNQYLEALSSTGLFGFFALILLQLVIAQKLYREGDHTLLACGVALAIHGLFQPVPLVSKALFAWLLGSAVNPIGHYKHSTKLNYVVTAVALLVCARLVVGARLQPSALFLGDAQLLGRAISYTPVMLR